MPDRASGHVTFGLAKLDLPAWLLLLSLFIIVGFMAAGFERARRFLRLRHSETLFETRAGEAIETLENLTSESRKTTELIFDAAATAKRINQKKSEFSDRLERVRDRLQNETFDLDSDRREFLSRISEFPEVADENSNLKNLTIDVEDIRDRTKYLFEEIRKRFRTVNIEAANAVNHAHLAFSAHGTEVEQIDTDLITSKLDKIAALSTNLKAFHSSISGADRRWHLWHDAVPVFTLAVLAALAIFYRVYVFVVHYGEPVRIASHVLTQSG